MNFLNKLLIFWLKKEHLMVEGLHKILNIKASMNNGLSLNLKESFAAKGISITPVPKPEVPNQKISDPHWLAGFGEGEGFCTYCKI